MPACVGGTKPKDIWINQFYWLAGNAICSLLDTPMQILAGWACAMMVDRLVNMNDYCATLPEDPGPNPFDIYLTGETGPPGVEAIDWLYKVWKAQTWNTYCECALPLGCATTGVSVSLSGTGNGIVHGTTDHVIPDSPTSFSFPYTATKSFATTGGTWQIRYLRADNTQHSILSIQAMGTSLSLTGTYTDSTLAAKMAAGVTKMRFTFNSNGAGTGVAWNASLSGTITYAGCTSPVEPYVPPALPEPDPDIPIPTDPLEVDCCQDSANELQQLRNMLSIVATEVDDTYLWVHEHLPVDCPDCVIGPPAYTPGASHSPLTGESSFAIGELVGVRVQVLGHPAGGKVLPGQPDYLWNMGWMSIMDGDSLIEEKRITRESFLWLPPNMKRANKFTWTLRDGVSIECIELVPA